MRFLFIFLAFLVVSCQVKRSAQVENELVTIQITDQNGLSETISSQERIERFCHVNFLNPQPYKKVLRLFRKDQEGKTFSVITSYYPNGQIQEYLEGTNTTALGAFKRWHSNGRLHLQAHLVGGPCDLSPSAKLHWLFEGQSQVYDEDGEQIALLNYKLGKLEGRSCYYRKTGVLEKIVDYKGDQIHGEKIFYFGDGNIKKRSLYQEGKKEGVSETFFSTGTPQAVEYFEGGKLMEGSYFSLDGSKIAGIKQGFGKRAIFCDEKLHLLATYQQGKKEGLIEIFNEDGSLHKSYKEIQGKKQGIEIEYFYPYELTLSPSEETKKKIQLTWDDDTLHGLVQTWYVNGRMQSEREMSRNQKNGRFLGWYEDGSIMFVEEYEADMLVKGAYYKKGQKEPFSTVRSGTGVAYLYEGDGSFLRKIKYHKGKLVD